MKLGEKIKKARTDANMTQKELAGDRITRNMLSQIENGKAMPSVSTVNYLTERLGLPSGYFFTDSEDETAYKKSIYISGIKEAYRSEEFEKCYSLCRKHFNEEDDELIFMYSDAALKLGIMNYKDGKLDSAFEYLTQSTELAKACCYDTFGIRIASATYLDLIRDVGYIPTVTESSETLLNNSELFQPLVYRNIINHINAGRTEYAKELLKNGFLSDRCYYLHVMARLNIAKTDYLAASNLLTQIIEEIDVTDIDSIMLFRIYSDLELCYKELEQYQNAYIYSEQKNTLIKKITLPRGTINTKSKV